MNPTDTELEIEPLVLHLRPAIDMTDDQFFEFCQINRDLRIERTAGGDLVLMSPAESETGRRNAEITYQLQAWSKQDGQGLAFDSSSGFRLPNGATRSPDAAWIRRSRLAPLTRKQKQKFMQLCPDFVIELRSPSDRLRTLQQKMEEYVANGAQLGWLIDPIDRRVYVYAAGAPRRELANPIQLPGDPVLPGFALNLSEIWEPAL